jgi:hypothetical protein
VREGGALRRGVGEAALYVADEDHRAVRRVPVPVGDAASVRTVELSGAPAQVLPLEGKVLVTLRSRSMGAGPSPSGRRWRYRPTPGDSR